MKIYSEIMIAICVNLTFPYYSMAEGVFTNKNEVSGEFEKHIPFKPELDREVNDARDKAKNQIGSGDVIEVLKPARDYGLEAIHPDDLGNIGREKRASKENIYFNDFETNYKKPAAAKHKRDMLAIAKSTEEKMQELTKILRDNHIDCEHVESANSIENPYYIDLVDQKNKEVEYKEEFCEKLQNNYDCSDNLSIICLQKSWKFYDWSDDYRWIEIGGVDAKKERLLYATKWKKKRFGFHMRTDINDKVRIWIAGKIQVNPWQIGDLKIDERGEHPIVQIGEKSFVFHKFKIGYKYRNGEEVCDKWSEEDWDERCGILRKQ